MGGTPEKGAVLVGDIAIGQGKSGRRGVALDDLAIVPSRRTRQVDDVDLSWKIDAYRFALPVVAAGLETPVTVDDAVAIGQHGALVLIDLEALWSATPDVAAIRDQLAVIKEADVRVAATVSVSRAEELAPVAVSAEADLVAIIDPTISAEAVVGSGTALNLKTFIRTLDVPVIVGGCASYSGALHLMRTGAAGVIVGVDRPDLGMDVPLASAIGDARAARVRHLDETGVYCHLIARGGIADGAAVAKAVACGADAVVVDAAAVLGDDIERESLVGSLREAMAICGFTDLKGFQNVEVLVR